MSQLNTITYSDFVRLADFSWLKGLESLVMEARKSGLFKVSAFPANSGDTKEYNEVDLEEYASEKDEGDQATQAKVQQGYTKILSLKRFGKDIKVTWEMRRRNKYTDVLNEITNLAKMQGNRMDLDLTHRLTFGTATSYTNKDGTSIDISVGDTLALFSTAHTLRGSSTTFRNRLANNPQVSKGAIEGMEKLVVEQTYNQFGEKMTLNHDKIWSSDDPNTANTIREHLRSTSAPAAPNAGVINVNQAKYTHVILPRLATTAAGAPDSTKAKYWGIASSAGSTSFLAVEQEPTLNKPALASNSDDVSTEDRTFTGRTSYGIATVSANWIKFSSGDGTA